MYPKSTRNMNKNDTQLKEQELCITCGICCDGTLFDKAVLRPGEKGTLPKKMEERYFQTEKGAYFKLPCPYFAGKCTIYNQKKAHVCSGFRCRLLIDFSKGKLPFHKASSIIVQAKLMREEIFNLTRQLLNSKNEYSFRELQNKLEKLKTESSEINPELESVIAKCIIFEALLVKYYMSEDEFNEMIITNEPITINDPL